jgi:5'-phosphate synthase pdxT subunit
MKFGVQLYNFRKALSSDFKGALKEIAKLGFDGVEFALNFGNTDPEELAALLKELKLFIPLKQLISNGLPVMATCAGAILLAEKIDNDPAIHFGTLPVTIRRNAFGRQLASFYTDGSFSGIRNPVPMPFIRAPQIISTADGVEILSAWQNQPTAVKYKNQLALTWHPEITGCGEIHRYFLENIVKKQG